MTFLPLGVVVAIMPWNFPYWQVFRFLAPALMVGNTAILKHASNVSGCALAIERIISEAGLPTGVFTTLLLPSTEIAALIADSRVAAVTLTGSEAAGVAVATASGHALKKTVLELGGSDAFMVLADADLAAAAQYAVRSRFQQAHDTEEAIALANQSSFGLGGNLWTRDLDYARQLARRLEVASAEPASE